MEILASPSEIKNIFVIITYRTSEVECPHPAQLGTDRVTYIRSRAFERETIDQIVCKTFHLSPEHVEDGFSVLSSFLFSVTEGQSHATLLVFQSCQLNCGVVSGNPMYIKLLLSRLIEDEVIVRSSCDTACP